MMRTFREDSDPAMLADTGEQQNDWCVQCISSVRGMAVAIEAVVTAMTDLGYPPKDVFGTRLALEEAICNAIKHGHQHDPNKAVEVRYCIRADHFLFEVEDQGPGFDPSQVPDPTAPENLERPCGRGLLLIGHYAAWVRYNPKGNCVTFCIYPSQPLPAESSPATVGASPCSIVP